MRPNREIVKSPFVEKEISSQRFAVKCPACLPNNFQKNHKAPQRKKEENHGGIPYFLVFLGGFPRRSVFPWVTVALFNHMNIVQIVKYYQHNQGQQDEHAHFLNDNLGFGGHGFSDNGLRDNENKVSAVQTRNGEHI